MIEAETAQERSVDWGKVEYHGFLGFVGFAALAAEMNFGSPVSFIIAAGGALAVAAVSWLDNRGEV